jgi:hypothetical protein
MYLPLSARRLLKSNFEAARRPCTCRWTESHSVYEVDGKVILTRRQRIAVNYVCGMLNIGTARCFANA